MLIKNTITGDFFKVIDVYGKDVIIFYYNQKLLVQLGTTWKLIGG